jgi:hypothetical protein
MVNEMPMRRSGHVRLTCKACGRRNFYALSDLTSKLMSCKGCGAQINKNFIK